MNTYFPTRTSYFLAAYINLSPAISDPQATYGPISPSDAVGWVKGHGTWGAYRSAFNYVWAATAIFLQRDLGLPNPPAPKSGTNLSPASMSRLTPIGNGTFTPPASGLPSTPGGAPNPTFWVTPSNTTDTLLDQAIAAYQSEHTVASAAVERARSTLSTLSTTRLSATRPSSTTTVTPAPSLITTSFTTTFSPVCLYTDVPYGGPQLYGGDFGVQGQCQCIGGSYVAPDDTSCTEACTSLPLLCTAETITEVITAA